MEKITPEKPPFPATDKYLMDVEKIAYRYDVCTRTIIEWKDSGFIPHAKLAPKCLRFPVAKCDAIVDRLMRGGNGGDRA